MESHRIGKVTEMSAFLLRRYRQLAGFLTGMMPKGLYGRSLLIIILPMVLLQSVLVFVFLERHWNLVTRRLSQTFSSDIALIVSLYEGDRSDKGKMALRRLIREKMDIHIRFLPRNEFALETSPQGPTLLHRALGEELGRKLAPPFRIIWPNPSEDVTVQVQLSDSTLQFDVGRSRTYASNSHIFIVWMVGTSLVLLGVALLFLHNQIRPIQALAEAAERFGLGRFGGTYRPRGAREVRQAGHAFIKMRNRIERQIEQRTIMLAGISHDLKTILTRFRLNLALLERNDDTQSLVADANEMEAMLDGYLTFAKDKESEKATHINLKVLLEDLSATYENDRVSIEWTCSDKISIPVRPVAFRRCVVNVLTNALRHANSRVKVSAVQKQNTLILQIDDDGPGIAETDRQRVFRAFERLDEARTITNSGSGLGLTIARDIVRRHGGDVLLVDSPLGGLRVDITMPIG